MKVLTIKTSDGCFILNLQDLTNIQIYNTPDSYNFQIIFQHMYMHEFIFYSGSVSYEDFQRKVLLIADFLGSNVNNLVLDFSGLRFTKYFMPRKQCKI